MKNSSQLPSLHILIKLLNWQILAIGSYFKRRKEINFTKNEYQYLHPCQEELTLSQDHFLLKGHEYIYTFLGLLSEPEVVPLE